MTPSPSPRFSPRVYLLLSLAIILLYAFGLTRDLAESWVGMHDWNGAFFSQLARNCLRYPLSLHHGMPIVAVGEAVPPPSEYSFYSTHPPGLVWLLAGVFRVLGESEATARLLPVVFSIASLGIFLRLIHIDYGWPTALTSGLVFANLPMAVYFGRMVDHEAIGLFFMLATGLCWRELMTGSAKGAYGWFAIGSWMLSIFVGVWIDWSMVLYAGLFNAILIWTKVRHGPSGRSIVLVCGGVTWSCLCIFSMIVYLVHAGLGGRWSDLAAVFFSRASEVQVGPLGRDLAAKGGAFWFTVENLTVPVIALAIIGLIVRAFARAQSRRIEKSLQAPSSRSIAPGILFVQTATAIAWVAIFWRQYERHNYWLFYLGPIAALWAGSAVVWLWRWLSDYQRSLAWITAGCALTAMVSFEWIGTRDYFGRLSFPPAEVDAWKEINKMTSQSDRILLARNPLRIEERGGYRFRNIVPPQLAYYLDRAFDVQPRPEGVLASTGTHFVFVLPVEDALGQEGRMRELAARFPVYQLGNQVVVVLRPAKP